MISLSPGVRRMCLGVRAPYPGLLDRVCRAAGFGRLYTEHLATEALDLGFATPGVDEAALIMDVVRGLHRAAGETAIDLTESVGSTIVAFHEGITRLEGDKLRGTAVIRLVQLVHELVPVTASGSLPSGAIVVGLTSRLFEDVGPDCGFEQGWSPVLQSKGWFRVF